MLKRLQLKKGKPLRLNKFEKASEDVGGVKRTDKAVTHHHGDKATEKRKSSESECDEKGRKRAKITWP